MADAPPPYAPTAQNNASNPGQNTYSKEPSDSLRAALPEPSSASQQHQSPNCCPTQPNTSMTSPAGLPSLFPQSFGFYHASGMYTDMVLALHADAPPIFHVSIHSGFSSQPSVILHAGPYESAPAMATADFHSFSSTVDVVAFNQPVSLEREGAFSTVRYFHYAAPQPDGQMALERFEWKSSSGPEVQLLQGRSHGMTCVRARTGEVVAAWARPNSGHRKKGKMAFLMRDRGFGDERLETMIVISVLSIMEKARRNRNARNASVGGAAGAAAC